MDEMSWRARLAKANINILDMRRKVALIEFTYHPKPGTFKWCKTIINLPCNTGEAGDELEYTDFQTFNAQAILDEVLKLRKELEN